MTLLCGIALALVAVCGTAVVLTREPENQAIVVSIHGIALTLLFLTLQAPDVALSELTVGAAAIPLIVLVTLARAKRQRQ